MIEVLPVRSAIAADVVEQVRSDIESALKHGGDFGIDDVKAKVAKRDWQLWVVTDAGKHAGVIITHIARRPAAMVCEIILLAGENAKRWLGQAEDTIATWARDLGCIAMEAAGRIGWERRMAARGWAKSAVIIRKELADA